MSTRKPIEKISFGLNAMLFIVIVGLLVYQQHLIRQISDNVQQQAPSAAAISDSNTQAENNTQTLPLMKGDMGQLEAKVETLRYQLEAAEEELDMAREDLADEQGGLIPDLAELAAKEKKMRENPNVMKMQRRMSENMIVENYGALFEMLELPDVKINDFKALLVDNQMKMEEMSLDMMAQSMSDKERNEKMQLIAEQQNAELEKQARDLLGAENYQEYDDYQRRLSERFVVKQFATPLSAGDGLSDEAEQTLIDAMYEARREVEAEYDVDSSDSPRLFIGVSSNDVENGIDKQVEIYDRYVESARSVLSESQAEEFETMIKGMQEMMAILAAETPS